MVSTIAGLFTCPRHTVINPLPVLSHLIFTTKISTKYCPGFTEEDTDITWVWSTWSRSYDITEQRRCSNILSLISKPRCYPQWSSATERMGLVDVKVYHHYFDLSLISFIVLIRMFTFTAKVIILLSSPMQYSLSFNFEWGPKHPLIISCNCPQGLFRNKMLFF